MKSWWLRLAHYARPQARGLSLLMLLMFFGVAVDVFKPWPLKLIVDYVLDDQPLPDAVTWLPVLPGANSPTGLLGWLAGATVLLFLVRQGLKSIEGYVQAGVGSRMVYELGEHLFDHLQRLSLRFHSQQRTGDLIRRVTTDSFCIRELVIGVGLPLLTSLVSLISMFIIMWHLHHSLSLLALLVLPLIIVLIKVFDRPMTERTYQHQQLEGEMMALAEQTLTALPVVQAFGREDYESRRFRTLSHQTLRAYLRAILAQVQFGVGVGATTAVGTAVIMVSGGFQALEGEITVGTLLVFLSYLASLYTPVENLAYLSSGFASAAGRARRVFDLFDADEGVQDAPEAKPMPAPSAGLCGQVCFEGVSFAYEPGRTTLRGVTFEARPGETVALVGSTGAGKSTLVSLIPRFFDPQEGRVTVDGVDIRSVQLTSLRAQISIVLQEPFLLPLTAAENIAYGCPGASHDEIIAAAVTANADEFIRKLPEGYDTVLAERGGTLSGGQRQRLAIARALLKNAPILILDEPTSALDAETEALVLEALERLIKGRTTFIIAHRLSTIRNADRIVVLERGSVAEVGTHSELLAGRSVYQSFCATQSRAASLESLAA